MSLLLLFESASGLSLFKTSSNFVHSENIIEELWENHVDFDEFQLLVSLHVFEPFSSAFVASKLQNAISEGRMTLELRKFLELNFQFLPKLRLGVADPKLAVDINQVTQIPCECSELVCVLLRGVRLHFERYSKTSDLVMARRSLGHSYSCAKMKFDVNKDDNMLVQAIFSLDTLDKDINSFSMRLKEWFSWHFPELKNIVDDSYLYANVLMFAQKKSEFSEDKIPGLTDIVGDEGKAIEIVNAAKVSVGQDFSEADFTIVQQFAQKVIDLADDRKKLNEYLVAKMNYVAPNLASLIGETIGARLIAHAGSLTNLAMLSSSSLQILGAEKALSRALKTQGNIPKYGLIYHSSFIGRASERNKGRLARYLANKCSLASRIDCFSEVSTRVFGEKLREQVEEILKFYDKGVAPRKNMDVMKAAMKEYLMRGLPKELEVDILLRLPVQTLLRLKCLSTAYYHLLSTDVKFITLHLRRNQNQIPSPGILIQHSQLYLSICHYAADYRVINAAVRFKFPHDDLCEIINICDGMICVRKYTSEEYSKLYLWNPLTKDVFLVPDAPSIPSELLGEMGLANFGFGFDPSTNEYKVISIYCSFSCGNYSTFKSYVNIYTLGKKSWRTLPGCMPYCLHQASTPVLVNGAIHWLENKPGYRGSYRIFSFDLEEESFQEIPKPDSFGSYSHLNRVEIRELGGLLSLSLHRQNHKLHIWVMTQYGIVESWSKEYVIQVDGFIGSLDAVCVSNSGELILNSRLEYVLYDNQTNSAKILHKSRFALTIYSARAFVGSLVSATAINSWVEAFGSTLGQHMRTNGLGLISIADIKQVVNMDAETYTRAEIVLLLERMQEDNRLTIIDEMVHML